MQMAGAEQIKPGVGRGEIKLQTSQDRRTNKRIIYM